MFSQNIKLPIAVIVLIALCLCSMDVGAQNTPMNCNDVQSMTFDENEIAGSWYEIARYPAPQQSYECVQVNLTAEPNNVLNIATTYSNTPSYPWVNQTMYASINGENTTGYNISYQNGPTMTPSAIFKLVYTDYTNYTLVCGYNDPSDMSTYFGVLLMRQRQPSEVEVDDIIAEASMNYAQFPNGTMTPIVQEDACFVNGAKNYVITLSTVTTLLAILFCLK